ncbi:MAG: YqgE/AlgH family protein [Magnetospirillum sp.]|nr:YqgE/AlgH family protein [Magnetospirillum sp.]
MPVQKTSGYLAGQLLIAMPQMRDPRFVRTVIYICAHTAEGAMGLVINREFEGLTFPELLDQLGIEPGPGSEAIRIHLGGPVEGGRGFVLHSTDYAHETTMVVDQQVALTATIDVLKAMSSGEGPRTSLLALGYAGWSPGQLDAEIRENVWLNVAADSDLVFGMDIERKWERAIQKLGIHFGSLSGDAGHA